MKKGTLLLSIKIILFLAVQARSQSIELNPASNSLIQVERAVPYIDIRTTSTDNHSGLRFFRNNLTKGGLFYIDTKNMLNLSTTNGTPGLVWKNIDQRVGVGTFDPGGKLHILANSTSGTPTFLVEENNEADGARINFENSGVSEKTWTLYGRNTNSALLSTNVFNIYHSSFGNVAQFTGDGESRMLGNTVVSGYTQMGTEAPKIKTRKFAGNLPYDNEFSIELGDIIASKILAYEILVDINYSYGGPPLNHRYKPNNDNPAGRNFRATVIGGSTSYGIAYFSDVGLEVRGQPYSIFVTYEE